MGGKFDPEVFGPCSRCYGRGVLFFHYNFCRIHQTLRVTPAMKAGLSGKVWSLADLVGLLP